MHTLASPLSPDHWIADVFNCKAVQKGGVIRRATRDIERFAGIERFRNELRLRGFQAIENNGQTVIFCNQASIKRIV